MQQRISAADTIAVNQQCCSCLLLQLAHPLWPELAAVVSPCPGARSRHSPGWVGAAAWAEGQAQGRALLLQVPQAQEREQEAAPAASPLAGLPALSVHWR